jgi:hypothetical protein
MFSEGRFPLFKKTCLSGSRAVRSAAIVAMKVMTASAMLSTEIGCAVGASQVAAAMG